MMFGIDQLLIQRSSFLDLKCALVTNDAAITSTGIKTRVAMQAAGINLVKLFSPEHGLSAKGADGLRQDHSVDDQTGLPVVSLYGDKLAPNNQDLEGLDVVFFDVPDIGCRFYTYLWTMTHVMESCAKAGVRIVILDRPNPTGLDLRLAEGPELDEANCSSFIGRWNIPLRHCCTLGELASYFAATRIPDLDLEVITVSDYSRNASIIKSFIPTSPAIQNREAAQCYPGTGLLEGVNLNEGRATKWAFRTAAAPWLNEKEVLFYFQQHPIPGLMFSPCSFIAQSHPYIEEACSGIIWHVTDETLFHPVKAGWKLLQVIQLLHPGRLQQRLYVTHANPSGEHHLDKLTGVNNSFSLLVSGQELKTEIGEKWSSLMAPFLLY